jgi:hypothetical protein
VGNIQVVEAVEKGEPERLENFADIVEWARSNGWTDFDFEGLNVASLNLQRP